jgi:acid phosphatase
VAVPARAATVPNFTHVYTIVMENHEFSGIIGNPLAPYINGLVQTYALGTAYTAVTHPSLPNYMSLTGGDTFFADDCVGCTVNAPSIADQLDAAGRSWKAYFEDMPAPCTTTESGLYTTHHNPFVHYGGIVGDVNRCRAHIVPLSDLGTDLTNGTVPDYAWITPNLCSDMHDCPVATGDAWLQAVVPDILNAPDFATSILFIVWDEGVTNVGGGGQVAMLAVSPLVLPGFRSNVAENHFSLLRTVQDAWSLGPLAQTSTAAPMTEYFKPVSNVCEDALALSYAAGTLHLGFTLGSATSGTWSTWLIAPPGAFQLWSLTIPSVAPAASFDVPISGVPNVGIIYILTSLVQSGAACGDLKSVNTAP